MNLFDLDSLKSRNSQIESEMISDSFWNEPKKAQALINELNNNKENIETLNVLSNSFNSILNELSNLNANYDKDIHELLDEEFMSSYKQLKEFEIKCLLNEEYDELNAILEIHPGAGGTDAQDWANMLYEMYVKYANNNNFKIETLDYEVAIDAGIKSVSFIIRGRNAYGLLKSEKGIHRLVRFSPFKANSSRQTSFASVDVIPEFINDTDITINEDDLKIDTYRSSGAGGQHINKTDSAVRITHIPTGIVVSCQSQRSQIQNKEQCMNTLKAKLYQLEIENKKNKVSDIRGEVKANEFGSQIRSYVFCPYTLVKDVRTGYETNNIESVMNGNINEFINEYLKYNKRK